MRGVAVMLAGARAKDLQFLQLVLYLLLDCALPQYFDPEPEVGQGSKQQQLPSLLCILKKRSNVSVSLHNSTIQEF